MAKVNCTHCGQENHVDDMTVITVMSDIKIKCTKCGQIFILPGPGKKYNR